VRLCVCARMSYVYLCIFDLPHTEEPARGCCESKHDVMQRLEAQKANKGSKGSKGGISGLSKTHLAHDLRVDDIIARCWTTEL
jgi:hypothetical protein